MPRRKADTLTKSVQGLLVERRAVGEKEKGLIRRLNKVLTKIGYEAVPTNAAGPAVRRRRRRRGRKPGRPPGRRARRVASVAS
ncbi:MAG: hypothetical protein IH796_10630 [Deltaproteobacteria bacterium]|nr:hypothetical protein [Deltaproteobacteria bacterium]